MSASHHHDQNVPLGALLGAGALVLLTLGAAAVGSADGRAPAEGVTGTVPAVSYSLVFEDAEDGAVLVRHEGHDAVVAEVSPQEGGFVRGVLRALFRTRRREGLDRHAPVTLERSRSGHHRVTDPLTGQQIDLASFGSTNHAAFALILRQADAAASVPVEPARPAAQEGLQ